ncbi:hypothetical protein H0H93_011898 [Arthromyces matolae]|nr:hypothetical protein H0H93_011898 [Arthromyces matolae]
MLLTTTVSQLLGYSSIACWLGAQFPQIIENIRNQSCDGLALPFLANWLLGAFKCTISLLAVLHVLNRRCFQSHWLYSHPSAPLPGRWTSLSTLPSDLIHLTLVAQYVYYSRRSLPSYTHPHPHSRSLPSASRTRYRTLSHVAANVAASAALAAQQDEQSHLHEHRRRWPVAPSHDEDDVDENAFAALADSFHSESGHESRRKNLSWSIERYRQRSGSLGGYSEDILNSSNTGRGRPLEREANIAVEPDVTSPSRRHSKASRRNTVVFLGVWMLFGVGTFAHQKRSMDAAGELLNGQKYEGQATQIYQAFIEPLSERAIGRVFAWLCTTLYLTSRLPQIWKNFVRKSVEMQIGYMLSSLFDGLVVGSNGSSELAQATPEQLRSLVLDYLAHQGYTNTAAAFVLHSSVRHVDVDGDETMAPSDLPQEEVTSIEHRKEIYHHIQCGHIDKAVALLKLHFPTVLSGPVPDRPHAQPFARRISDVIPYISATSTDPAHLALNLRILAFIESCRTRPLEYLPPNGTKPHTNADRVMGSEKTKDAELPESPESGARAQMSLLNMAQKLLAHVQMLPDEAERQIYLAELKNVSGLLAYKVPEESLMRKYLAQERRDAVADQVHRAILERQGLCSISGLELLVRYTSNLWFFANRLEAKSRPGVGLPPSQKRPPTKEPEVKIKQSF